MPRRRPRDLRPPHPEPSFAAGRTAEVRRGRTWVVQELRGSQAGADRAYRCPGCDHAVAGTTPHLVVWPQTARWPDGGGPEERRHWHRTCWQRFG